MGFDFGPMSMTASASQNLNSPAPRRVFSTDPQATSCPVSLLDGSRNATPNAARPLATTPSELAAHDDPDVNARRSPWRDPLDPGTTPDPGRCTQRRRPPLLHRRSRPRPTVPRSGGRRDPRSVSDRPRRFAHRLTRKLDLWRLVTLRTARGLWECGASQGVGVLPTKGSTRISQPQ